MHIAATKMRLSELEVSEVFAFTFGGTLRAVLAEGYISEATTDPIVYRIELAADQDD